MIEEREPEAREVVFAVQQVEEIPGARGYRITAVGHFAAPERSLARWDEPPAEPKDDFFPDDAAMSAHLELEWSAFAKPRPALSYYGATFRVTLEPLSVPQDENGQMIDKRNGGLQRPSRRT